MCTAARRNGGEEMTNQARWILYDFTTNPSHPKELQDLKVVFVLVLSVIAMLLFLPFHTVSLNYVTLRVGSMKIVYSYVIISICNNNVFFAFKGITVNMVSGVPEETL